jgi:SAM-dependent methyltransferase
MSELSRLDPTERFTGLSERYAQHRPSYPAAAVDCIIDHCALGQRSLMLDVGCGTGISARLFAGRGMRVIGVEPNAEMRAAAEAVPSGNPARVAYQAGTAEDTGLPAGIADAVLAAQSFHWFQSEAAMREFHRLLKPEGWAILMWNQRDEHDPFTAAYGAIIRSTREGAVVEGRDEQQYGMVLLESPLFREGESRSFGNEQVLDAEGLLGRAFSASYAPREPAQATQWSAKLRAIFQEFQRGGTVVLRSRTSVYLAQRASS